MNKGKLIWHVACDESGIDGQKYYGFGSLWMKYQRRGDFSRIIRQLCEKHGYNNEIKWQKAHNKRYADFYAELIDIFFIHPWLAFHCLLVRKGMVDKEYHNGDYDLARMKHFTMLIVNKVKAVHLAHRQRQCEFRIEVDPLASRYKKADQVCHQVANNKLKQQLLDDTLIRSVITKDSKNSVNIQISDFLLGAVMSGFQGKASSLAKLKVAENIASYLGWEALRYDTSKTERKFNIWYFHPNSGLPREVFTKPVELRYPLEKT